MKILGIAVCITSLLGANGAFAADLTPLITNGPPLATPQPITCTGLEGFVLTDCQLAWYGVRLYGTVDIGATYQTHGAPFDPNFVTGASYFIQKMNRSSMFGVAPNALSQSNVGIKGSEPIAPGWSFVFQLETGFDPASLRLADSPRAEASNTGVPVNQQTTNGDSSRAGQFDNSVGFFGVSSPTFGTLTVLRQNSLALDGIIAYDPMAASYAFSPIGFSGVAAGGGDTENARYSTSAKYRVTIGDFRAAALAQFGGYSLNNGSNGAYEGQVGGDFRNLGPLPGVLSVDAVGGFNKDAVNLSLAGAATNAAGYPTGSMLPQTMTATISNNTNVMALAKYAVGPLKFYFGYEWNRFAPPSDAQTAFTDISGNYICAGCNTATGGTNITNIAYSSPGNKDKILQIVWFGVRYEVIKNVDLVGAYYHYDQNNYALSAANVAACAAASTSKAFCHGTMDAFSGVIDWKFLAKWDTYIGAMYSGMNGGLANGYLARNNVATTAGLRFRF
jgi:predicted porin